MSYQRNMFGSDVTYALTEPMAEGIQHYVTQDTGGWQEIMREINRRMRKTESGYLLTVDAEVIAKVERYAYDYGNGGWQNALRAVLKVWRPTDELGRPA